MVLQSVGTVEDVCVGVGLSTGRFPVRKSEATARTM